MLVAPSILAADFLHLAKDVETVNAHADIFHLDIMDGTFVPNISFGFPVVEAIAREAKKPMDVHLMIVHPEKYVERFAKAGAAMISFHYEAAKEESDAVIDLIHSFGVKAGIVINPDCPVESIFPYLGKVDYVLLMSVFAVVIHPVGEVHILAGKVTIVGCLVDTRHDRCSHQDKEHYFIECLHRFN